MSIKRIKKHNPQQFLDDLTRVRDVMVIMPRSNAFLHVTKQELRQEAMNGKIHYYITDTIFKVVRDVMVVT